MICFLAWMALAWIVLAWLNNYTECDKYSTFLGCWGGDIALSAMRK